MSGPSGLQIMQEQQLSLALDHSSDRIRVVRDGTVDTKREFVLYWMHNALRAHENPALNLAIQCANEHELPLLVYQGLSERYRFASDRHHTFILEGARDVQRELAGRGIPYVFHLERPHDRGPWLRELAARAALVVTEEMPVDPITGWLDRLRATVNTPIRAVDTSCIVPMQTVGRSYQRAFEFRKATQRLAECELNREWSEIELHNKTGKLPPLPFEAVDLNTADIPTLVAECKIDHGTGPVPHTQGGTIAGYERWNAFLSHGMSGYARLRNDALKDGVSRMSAYLHYGMVSPFRLARETMQSAAAGSEKYLDELLIWRELAWAFCFYQHDHESLRALPRWAQETLNDHSGDARPELFDWETLARGETGDQLWDAAQKSLLIHGELHNNVRMTWGKALLQWKQDPSAVLAAMIDLNHRYALDGRDPASYGGILWCLGQFDRPFSPEQPVLGSVRPRPTSEHARRLDVASYLQKTTRPLTSRRIHVAVVGAGIAGLTCARTLADHGLKVTVFDKGRRVGGRMSTRLTESGLSFDHGCQYFSAKDHQFRRYVEAWCEQGIVAEWPGAVVEINGDAVATVAPSGPRFVGVPGMNAICRHLARDLDVRNSTRVDSVVRSQGFLKLTDVSGASLGDFDVVVVAVPPAQAVDLVESSPALTRRSTEARMQPCWSVMVSFDQPIEFEADGAFIGNSILGWVARNSGKPGRGGVDAWILQATPEWSTAHVDLTESEVSRRLLAEFLKQLRLPASKPAHLAGHRWMYALASDPSTDGLQFDSESRIGICGDWCHGNRVEDAFLSGQSVAGQILGRQAGIAHRENDARPVEAGTVLA